MVEYRSIKALSFRVWTQASIALALVLLSALTVLYVSPDARIQIDIVVYASGACAAASVFSVLLINVIRRYPGVEEFSYALPSLCLSYAFFTAMLLLSRIPYSRSVILLSFISSLIFFGTLYSSYRRRSNLIIGVVPEGDYERLIETPGVDWKVLRDVNDNIDGFDAISVDLWADLSDEWERQLASYALSGMPVYHSKHLLESLTGRVEIERLSENTFGTLTPLITYMTAKRVVDAVAAIAAFVILSPFLLIVGILIRLDSEGPAIFRQVRTGYRGKPFQVFKFRTMTIADPAPITSQTGLEAAMTKDNDQRITGLGKFLRRTRIDELPQIINVIKGEMSWIGPRPEADILSRWYEKEIPFYRYRHIVRPGITGWAQVTQGHVVEVDQVREKLHYDFYYIKNFSPWIDVVVFARTIKTIISGFGAK